MLLSLKKKVHLSSGECGQQNSNSAGRLAYPHVQRLLGTFKRLHLTGARDTRGPHARSSKQKLDFWHVPQERRGPKENRDAPYSEFGYHVGKTTNPSIANTTCMHVRMMVSEQRQGATAESQKVNLDSVRAESNDLKAPQQISKKSAGQKTRRVANLAKFTWMIAKYNWNFVQSESRTRQTSSQQPVDT